MALVLACFGSGAGWILFFAAYVPANFWVAEAFPFLSSFANPHFPLGLSLLLIVFSRFLKSTFNTTDHLVFFVLGLLISIIMPFGIVMGCLVIGIEILIELINKQRRRISISIAFLLGGVPFLLYQFLISTSDPILSIWNEQNNTPSPPIWDLLFSFSPILIIAIWRLIKYIRSPKKEELVDNAGLRLMLIWFVIGIVLVYFPFSLQRRFMFGLFVPICGIGIWGLSYLRSSWKSLMWKMTFSLSVISTVMTLILSMLGIYQHDPLLFMSDKEVEAVQWIKSNTSPDAVILASPHLSMFIPAQTGRRVIYGHPFETINAKQEMENVEKFYNDSWGNEQASRWLSEKSVQFIVFDDPEGKWGIRPFPDCSVSFAGKVVICTPGELW